MVSESTGNSERRMGKRYGLVSKSLLAAFTKNLGIDSVNKLVKNKIVEFLKHVLKNYCHEENIRDELGWEGAIPFMDGPILTSIAFNSIINHVNVSSLHDNHLKLETFQRSDLWPIR